MTQASASVAVVDYGIGNLRSAEKALQRAGAAARLVDDADQISGAAGVVLPGVGAFGAVARALAESGLRAAVVGAISAGVPFLGICVGFQLLYEGSDESPGAEGFGLFPGVVSRIPPDVKHPQMQWNKVVPTDSPPPRGLDGLDPSPWFYFVHSFAPPIGRSTVATCDYGGQIAAMVEEGNIWATQFHPEKSGPAGLVLLGNFAARCERYALARAGAGS